MDRAIFHGLNANNITLILADLFTFLVVFFLSLLCIELFYDRPNIWEDKLALLFQFLAFSLPLHFCSLAVGLYNEKLRERQKEFAIRIFVAIVTTYLILTLVESMWQGFYPQTLTQYLATLAVFIYIPARFIVIKFKLNQLFKRKVLVFGASEKALVIEEYLQRKTDYIGLDFHGFWSVENEKVHQALVDRLIETPDSFVSYVRRNKISQIVIATEKKTDDLPFEDLLLLKQKRVQLTDVFEFIEKETGQVVVDGITPSWFMYQKAPASKIASAFYWLFNTLIAFIIGFITLPIMVLTAILIKLEGGWRFPVIYSQKRIGLDGRRFSIYKFTSMHAGAEKNGAQWAQKNDPRVTKIGKIIRKYRIDELPQLYNVIVGDMFFVGPRPERPQFTKRFQDSIPFYAQRHNVKPGLTGWAQLKYPYGSCEEDAFEKLKFDLYYIKKRSFFFDLLILLKTSEIILFGKGR